ncbi:hypothetical protein GGF32_007166 [Allomyces javanicus]|nr:hypothetical protein GGF32_007166 [Allomyces javanicus]
MEQTVAHLTTLLHTLASTDNEQRAAAEEVLSKEYLEKKPDLALSGLIHILRNNPDVPLRSFAAVLFRRLALQPVPVLAADGTKTHTSALFMIQETTRRGCLAELLGALAAEPVVTVRKKLCDCISEVTKALLNKQVAWPELTPAVLQCVRAAEPEYRESAFRIFGSVPKLLMPNDVLDMVTVGPIFESGLAESEVLAVRITALNAAVFFLIEAGPDTKAASFSGLMVQMLNVLPALLGAGNEEGLTEAFTALIELAANQPKLFRPVLPQILNFALSIIGNAQLEATTRHSCLELLLTIVDEAPAMVRKLTPDFPTKVIPICLNMMAQLEDDEAWHTTSSIEEQEDENDEDYVIGEQAMDRIARKLGAVVTTPVAFTIIPQMLAAQEWQQRHAALMAISAIGEGCHKVLNKDLGKVVNMVTPFTQDPHPRVRHAACNCVGQMATDFAPSLQKKFHKHVIPALMACMDDVANPRVQAHGAAALVNFCEEVERTDLAPYLEALFGKLVTLASSPKIYLQEQAITTMATVADAAEDAFVQYYPAVMPALLQILSTPNSKELRLLRGKAMECATLIAMAVKKPVFQNHAQLFLEALARIQNEVTDPDDPQVSYLMHAWARLCTVLAGDFVPYLPIVMPPLLTAAQIKPEVALLDVDDSDEDYSPEDGWQQAMIDGQRLCIRTSLLDEKCSAIEMVMCYARHLGTGFKTYVPQVMEILIPNLLFYYHDGVRHAAMRAIPPVLAAAQDEPTAVLPLWSVAFDKIAKLLPQELDVEMAFNVIAGLTEVIQLLGKQSLNDQQAATLMRVLNEVLKEYYDRVKAREEQRQDEDFDPDQEEAIEDEAALENMVITEIAKLIQTLLKVYGTHALPLVDQLMDSVVVFLNESDEDLILLAVSVFDDLAEYTGPALATYMGVFGERILQLLASPLPSVRQSVAYGVGIAATKGGPAVHPLCLAAVPRLVEMVRAPKSRDDDNVVATENAVAALARILRSDVLPVQQRDEALAFFVTSMPVVFDEEEAVVTTSFLLDLVEAAHPAVGAQLEHTVDALLEVLYQGTLDDDQQLQQRALADVKTLLAGMPQDKQTAIWNALPADKRSVLKERGFF